MPRDHTRRIPADEVRLQPEVCPITQDNRRVVGGGWQGGGMDGMMRRVYGADHDDPDPGPRPGHAYVELVGGPLDGLLVDVTGWSEEDRAEGAALITELGQFGAGGRAVYGPGPVDGTRWFWEGDSP